jgi:hypothetical protein
MSDTQGFYVGADGRPAEVAVADPLFQWTVYGRYQSGAECDKTRAELGRRSLHLNPTSATAVAWSFAKCLEDSDPLLRPDQGPIERLPSGASSQPVETPPQRGNHLGQGFAS